MHSFHHEQINTCRQPPEGTHHVSCMAMCAMEAARLSSNSTTALSAPKRACVPIMKAIMCPCSKHIRYAQRMQAQGVLQPTLMPCTLSDVLCMQNKTIAESYIHPFVHTCIPQRYTYVCMYVFMYVCMYTHTHSKIYTQTHMSVRMYVHV